MKEVRNSAVPSIISVINEYVDEQAEDILKNSKTAEEALKEA